MTISINTAAPAPIFAPAPAARVESQAGNGAAQTTLAVEKASSAAVVYQPSPVERQVALTYSNGDKKRRDAQAQATVSQLQSTKRRDGITAYWTGQQQRLANGSLSDGARIAAATGGTNLPPPNMPKSPGLSAVIAEQHNVWGPVRPILTQMPDGWAKMTPASNRKAGRI